MDNKELKNIDMTAKFSNFQVINKDFTRCRCNVFYTGKNRNYSNITEDALKKFIARKGYANVPVVAHLMKDDNGRYYVGAHDRKIVLSNEGIDVIDETVPFGVIPEDCNPCMELITERSGEQRQYFSVDIILWTHRYPIMDASYSDDIYFNQSMEIFFEDSEMDGDYIKVNDFSMSALCLLNRSLDPEKNCEPCFESSRVKKFSIDENQFKQNFELMLEKLKQYELGDEPIQNTDAIKNHDMKGDTKMDLNRFVEIFSAIKTDADVCKYRLLSVTDSKVFALDMENYKPYGFDYAVTTEEDAENIVVDFESKAEMSLSATEKITDENFEEFDIKSAIDAEAEKYAETKTAELTAILEGEFNKKVDELKASYDDLSASYAVAMKKLEEYEAKEAQAKAEQHEADVKAMFEKYAEKLGKCSEFLVYKAKCNPAEVTVDELNEKLTLMVGKYMMDSQTKKNFSYNPTETKVTKVENEVSSRYGHLLDKYMK